MRRSVFEWNGSRSGAKKKLLGVEAARELCRDMAEK
jgi:hypothetical protein